MNQSTRPGEIALNRNNSGGHHRFRKSLPLPRVIDEVIHGRLIAAGFPFRPAQDESAHYPHDGNGLFVGAFNRRTLVAQSRVNPCYAGRGLSFYFSKPFFNCPPLACLVSRRVLLRPKPANGRGERKPRQ